MFSCCVIFTGAEKYITLVSSALYFWNFGRLIGLCNVCLQFDFRLLS